MNFIPDARNECRIHFGLGWDLATFSSEAELSDVLKTKQMKPVIEALWIGYKNTKTGFVDNFGNNPSFALPWDDSNAENPEPNGPDDSCVR